MKLMKSCIGLRKNASRMKRQTRLGCVIGYSCCTPCCLEIVTYIERRLDFDGRKETELKEERKLLTDDEVSFIRPQTD